MEIKKHYLGVSLSLPLDTVPFHAILRDSSNSSWQYAYMSRKKRKEGEGGGGDGASWSKLVASIEFQNFGHKLIIFLNNRLDVLPHYWLPNSYEETINSKLFFQWQGHFNHLEAIETIVPQGPPSFCLD